MPIFSFIRHTLTELFRNPHNWRQIYKQTSSTFHTWNLERVPKTCWEEKKQKGRHNKAVKWFFNYFKKKQKQPPEVFYKKAVIYNSENYEIVKSTYFVEHLRTAASENVFIKIIDKEF